MAITDERYVSFTTFRRNGDPVSTPVWIAPLGDGRAGFGTGSESGKAKRLRNDPKVTLRPCDMRGNVADGAEPTTGTAEVVTAGPDVDAVEGALGRKYGFQHLLLRVGSKIKSLIGKSATDCVVVISLTDQP